MKYVSFFDQITLADGAQFGGKNSSLGQMVTGLQSKGIRVPYGFATSAQAYRYHLEANGLLPDLERLVNQGVPMSKPDEESLRRLSGEIRELITSKPLPDDLAQEVREAYHVLSRKYDPTAPCDVAVRSSATAEDLPGASFAGQQETYLHIQGEESLLVAIVQCMASLFTERAMIYRKERGFSDLDVAISVGVQKMVRSGTGSGTGAGASGVMFTLDPETGFDQVVTINSTYGLGETLVQGQVTPDEFVVHKELAQKGFRPIIRKELGAKDQKLVYRSAQPERPWAPVSSIQIGSIVETVHRVLHPHELPVKLEPVPAADRDRFSLTDDQVLELARWACEIEAYYSQLHKAPTPMDIEWALDGVDGKLYIVQARPETIFQGKKRPTVKRYAFEKKPPAANQLLSGTAVGTGIASGVARTIASLDDTYTFNDGDILVTDMTDPDWLPLLRRASGIVTNRGGRTCHAAIVSRELGKIALVGTGNATTVIKDGAEVTLDCSTGMIGHLFSGIYPFAVTEVARDHLKRTGKAALYVNLGDPDQAFVAAQLPVDGVGLARLEFIISSSIGVHPNAVVHPEQVTDGDVKKKISEHLGADEHGWAHAYQERLARGIGMIAAAFYPRPVIVRCTDFKSNEYRSLLGGTLFEPQEENPMLGLRGAARYLSSDYRDAFVLECAALKQVREQFGCDNIKILLPFVRSVDELRAVIDLLASQGLKRGASGKSGTGLEILMMVEIPDNALQLEAYAPSVDGFSIGSNDLTQLTLGVDRDSELVRHLYDEQSASVKQLMAMAIEKAKAASKPIGICGQAPSDFPELKAWLEEQGITSLSLSPDSIG